MDHDFPLHRSPICFGIPEKSLLPLLCKAMGAFPAWYQQSFKKCPRPSLTSLYRYRSQTSSYRRQTLQHTLECHAVGIIGIFVHDPIHVGSRLLGAGDSFREVSHSLFGDHVNGFINHLIIPLWNSAYYAIAGRLESLRGNFYLCPFAHRAGRVWTRSLDTLWTEQAAKGGERALVVPSNLDDRQILFSNEEDDEASHTASKNTLPSCAAEWHFLDLVEVLVEAVNFTEL